MKTIDHDEYSAIIIGRNLKRLREKKGLSVKQVVEQLNLGSPQVIYNYESGKCYPQADTMLKLMIIYEANPNDLIKHEKEHRKSYVVYFDTIKMFERIFEWI